jgi:hypothetical protein
MKIGLLSCALVLCAASAVCAQAPSSPPAAAAQVASAISALPEEFREGASVLGYADESRGLVELRKGAGPYICLADDPADDRFHVACYHSSLEPFMARGRELRAQKVTNVDSVRYAEIDAGKLKMPSHPAALYSLTGKPEMFDRATGTVTGARPLYVVYLPFATPETTGIPAKAGENTPWLMFPGTAKAHIMFVPRMQ